MSKGAGEAYLYLVGVTQTGYLDRRDRLKDTSEYMRSPLLTVRVIQISGSKHLLMPEHSRLQQNIRMVVLATFIIRSENGISRAMGRAFS